MKSFGTTRPNFLYMGGLGTCTLNFEHERISERVLQFSFATWGCADFYILGPFLEASNCNKK